MLPMYINLMLYMLMMLSTIMVISSTNMFMIWFSLELNLFSFLPLLMNKMNSNEIEASINYFLMQAMGSSLFLSMTSIMYSLFWSTKFNNMMFIIVLLMKMGAAPCHYWYPMSMEMISWTNCFILSTWQKIAPLFILLYIILPKTNNLFIATTSLLNAIIGGIMGLSQTSLKKIMAYSSITHMGWILSGPITNNTCLSITYFSIYSLMTLPLFMMFNKTNSNKVHDLWYKQNLYLMKTIITTIMLLSLSGMPPLTGFIPKLMMMNALISYSYMFMIMLISGSLMNLFFYLNIILNMLINNKETHNMQNKQMNLNTINTILSINMLMILILIL